MATARSWAWRQFDSITNLEVDQRMGQHRILFLGVGVVCVLGMIIGAMLLWPGPSKTKTDADDPEVVTLGAQVYSVYCASCHGASLEGQANWRERNAEGRLPASPHDDSGHSWHHSDELLFTMTKNGPAALPGMDDYESDMPAFGDILSDEEIWAAISYIKSTWSAMTRMRQEEIDRRSSTE